VHEFNRRRFGIAANDADYPSLRERQAIVKRFSGADDRPAGFTSTSVEGYDTGVRARIAVNKLRPVTLFVSSVRKLCPPVCRRLPIGTKRAHGRAAARRRSGTDSGTSSESRRVERPHM
jgi:hypothetical protein